jgi:hypothetical protein
MGLLKLTVSLTALIRGFGLCLLLVLAGSAASAQSKSTSWIKGTWEGTGYQTDDQSTWAMVLKAGGKRFGIDYPSLSCGGSWKLISLSGSRARFRERLDHGQDKCADNGNVLIERLNRNQILFLYSNQGEKALTASAILNRKR